MAVIQAGRTDVRALDEPPSLRTRWMILRARLSTAGLLARFDERMVVSYVTAIHGGLAVLIIGLFAWIADLPLVFPALGPTAFILFSAPMSPAAAPRAVVLGHLAGLACGYAVWQLMGLLPGSPVSMQTEGWSLFCGMSLALALTSLLLVRLSCPHAPACATGMIVVLGSITQWHDLLSMALAVIWLTAQAVVMNRLAGLPVPLWHPRTPDEA